MSDLKPKATKIILGGKEYGLLFTLNVIDEIQDIFDLPFTQIAELMEDERKVYKVLRVLFTLLINEAIDDSESGQPHVDEKYIGRKLTIAELPQLKNKITGTLLNGMPESDEEIPNAQSE